MSNEKFLHAYANLPEPEREQIVVIIDDKPYSWNIVYGEIANDTALGKKMLQKLEAMGIL